MRFVLLALADDADARNAIVRTALAVEPRDGRLCVFMPFVAALEDYVAVIAAVEAAATRLGLAVHIEGNAPPVDPRVRQNLGLVVGLQGRFAEAEAIVRADLPPDEAAANAAYLREMLAKQGAPRQLAVPPRRG